MSDKNIENDFDIGSIIRGRFKLEKVLGVGGMGKVYKALDLLKAEAKDRKPHVAIKLLNDNFREHPESFIALQREASRQQRGTWAGRWLSRCGGAGQRRHCAGPSEWHCNRTVFLRRRDPC